MGTLGDGRALEGQGGAVPFDVVVVFVSVVCRDGAVIRHGVGSGITAALQLYAAHEDGAADLRILGTALVRQQGADSVRNQAVTDGVGVEVKVDGGQRNRCVAGVVLRLLKLRVHISHGVVGALCARRNDRIQRPYGGVNGRQVKAKDPCSCC